MNPSLTNATMANAVIIRIGGAFLVAGALAFMAVFAFLAARFNYPAVLDGSAEQVLPSLLQTGDAGRLAWAIYGFLPLIWIPAGVGAFYALRRVREGSMRVAMLFAVVSALSMMLGLLRWPSIHWTLAQSYANATEVERAGIAATFAGLNSFLGNYVGEFLGELAFSVFFLLSALAMLARDARFPRWVGYLGVGTAVAGLIGMFRNATGLVDPIAAINNYLLPLWMIVFGVALLRYRPDNREALPGSQSLPR
ncbi:MAG TPA: DUF4386 domain-containing protein [Gemmatimonadaceae bacterium]|nr:DUF4386 domain-containing protein [Gemmatimonadaceae bacterium]